MFFTPRQGRTPHAPIRRWVLVGLLSIGMTLGAVVRVHAQDLTILGLTLGDTKLDYGRASVGAVLKF